LKFGKAIYLISHRHEGQLEADETLALHWGENENKKWFCNKQFKFIIYP
jgi:hypothetical protein